LLLRESGNCQKAENRTMAWVFEDARETFGRHRERWDEINKASGNHLLLDSAFVELLIRHFASADTLLGRSNGGSDAGMVLVEPVRQGLWQTFQPSQAPLGLILLDSKEDAVGRVREIIRGLPGYALSLSVLQQDPDFTRVGSIAHGEVEQLDYITTARLTMNGTFEEYWKTRSHNLTHNLSRQRRRFKEQGVSFELITHRGAQQVAEEVQIYGQLESAGWKGKEGTAITAENAQGLFYRAMLESFCKQNESVIYRLNMNGTPVASALCLERNASLMVLKITYDETIPKCSPGLLLHEEMLKSLFTEKRIKTIEYYGRYTDWHRKWTDDTRQMYHLTCYRFGWLTTARRAFKAGLLFGRKAASDGSQGYSS
jgi:CelD/BcsL family acetyltransferase involved in cellulose biosynthesis